ncbi:MAG TPA: universal stress protein [Gaiellaceae bacterium]|nr:universal stress protein [Gaiellaceae bacterium]
MFQHILLAWEHDNPPAASLDAARALADAYEAELTVCCFGGDAVEAQAAAGADAFIEALSAEHAARKLAEYAHEHGFDLVVIGRKGRDHLLGRHLIDDVPCPVLVVNEEGGST